MATRLFDSVIIGFDGSSEAEDALALGRVIASLDGSGLVLAYVTDHQPPFERQNRAYAQARREQVHEVLEPAVAELGGANGVEPTSIDSSSPARGLHELAFDYCKYGAGVLVIGSTHRSPVGRVVLGSVGEMLASGSPCPMMVAPRGFAQAPPRSIERIVAGFNGTDEALAALDMARSVATATGAKLEALAVVHHPTMLGRRNQASATASHREALQERLDEALADIGPQASGTLLEGDPAERLAEAAAEADLLVLGARSYGPGHHVLVGTVSSKLMRRSPTPVLLVPRPPAE